MTPLDRKVAPAPDILAQCRESLLESHIIHDFKLERVRANLAGCYGAIMGRVYRRILRLVRGGRIIDCGCGFGQFTRVAIDAGFEVHAIDVDNSSLEIAREVSRNPLPKGKRLRYRASGQIMRYSRML